MGPSADTPRFTDQQLDALLAAMGRWLGRHPEPDAPVLGRTDGRRLSAREMIMAVQLAVAVRRGGPASPEAECGEDVLVVIENGLRHESFQRILGRFDAAGTAPGRDLS